MILIDNSDLTWKDMHHNNNLLPSNRKHRKVESQKVCFTTKEATNIVKLIYMIEGDAAKNIYFMLEALINNE